MLLQASHQAMPKNRPRTRQAQGQVLGTPELPSPSGHAQNQIPAISPTGESHTSHQPAVAESIRCCAYDHARLRQRHPHSRHTYVNARAYSIECARRPTCPRMPPNGDTEGETILHLGSRLRAESYPKAPKSTSMPSNFHAEQLTPRPVRILAYDRGVCSRHQSQ